MSSIEKSKPEEKPGEQTLILIGGLALIVVLLAVNGFVLSWLWQWFVVPLGVGQISIAQAFGLSLLVSYAVPTYQSKESTKFSEVVVKAMGKQSFALGFGWLAAWLMASGW